MISDLVGYDIEFPVPKEPNIHLKTDQNKTAKELASIIYNEIFDDLNLGNTTQILNLVYPRQQIQPIMQQLSQN